MDLKIIGLDQGFLNSQAWERLKTLWLSVKPSVALCVIKNAKKGGDGYLKIYSLPIKLNLLEY